MYTSACNKNFPQGKCTVNLNVNVKSWPSEGGRESSSTSDGLPLHRHTGSTPLVRPQVCPSAGRARNSPFRLDAGTFGCLSRLYFRATKNQPLEGAQQKEQVMSHHACAWGWRGGGRLPGGLVWARGHCNSLGLEQRQWARGQTLSSPPKRAIN
ncbi:hypothetical protein SKAU_G00393420 [Synaphobranchus kaupii]|uniref:Uncharacterized protein n=1 Tax=Synaphobranchus kaupii TaxID=118154 RepID=A0A9Q1IDU6_SYNKA|nr:hypothetical protein SKAU_G00393420 [Synaphobranchus kaupii]